MAIQQQGERHPISLRHLQMLDDLIQAQQDSADAYAAKIENQ
jgi:hypothetical protein